MEARDFDEIWYAAEYPIVSATGLSAAEHYNRFGRYLGYFPNSAAKGVRKTSVLFSSISDEWLGGPLPEIGTKLKCDVRGSFSSHAVEVLSLSDEANLNVEFSDGSLRIQGVGNDPQGVLIKRDGGGAVSLVSGGYLFSFSAHILSGSVTAPCLYIDFGDGFGEDESRFVELEFCRSRQLWWAYFIAPNFIEKIRFDPSCAAFDCYVKCLQIEAISPTRTSFPAHNVFGSNCDVLHSDFSAVSSDNYKLSWLNQFSVAKGARDPSYAPRNRQRSSQTPLTELPFRTIAFYLPQFHQIEENDTWWGKGFTEWTNVSKAVPQFVGHDQPRLPGELGFYNLSHFETIAKQIDIAKSFNVYGFCFHYYWFSGRRLLEKPLETFVQNQSEMADFPFCVCWANENWTRRWDGADAEVLMAQSHSDSDHEAVFYDLLRYFKDPRYIKVDGRPLVVIYRPSIITDVSGMVSIWRSLAEVNGLPGLYILATNAFGFSAPEEYGMDGLCEFPPHGLNVPSITNSLDVLNDAYEGTVYNYNDVVEYSISRLTEVPKTHPGFDYFPSVMMGWDNEARKPGKGNTFAHATPRAFYRWVDSAGEFVMSRYPAGKRFVFVNAWNEWAEGTYLEPDRRLGYAYLTAISEAVDSKKAIDNRVKAELSNFDGREPHIVHADAAVFLHIYYEDMVEYLNRQLSDLRKVVSYDLYITIPSNWTADSVRNVVASLEPMFVLPVSNRGRDILPFLKMAKQVDLSKYKWGLKIHTKKSKHIIHGELWGNNLISALVSEAGSGQAVDLLRNNDRLSVVAPRGTWMPLSGADSLLHNKDNVMLILGRYGMDVSDISQFVAGTMFWFDCSALSRVLSVEWGDDDFGPELGAIDGTLAHAFERVLPAIISNSGSGLAVYDVHSLELLNPYSP